MSQGKMGRIKTSIPLGSVKLRLTNSKSHCVQYADNVNTKSSSKSAVDILSTLMERAVIRDCLYA